MAEETKHADAGKNGAPAGDPVGELPRLCFDLCGRTWLIRVYCTKRSSTFVVCAGIRL